MRNIDGPNAMYFLLYVDNMLVTNKSISEAKKIKELLGAKFDMKKLRPIRRILGLEICKNRSPRLLLVSSIIRA